MNIAEKDVDHMDLLTYKTKVEEYIERAKEKLPPGLRLRAELPTFSWSNDDLVVRIRVEKPSNEEVLEVLYLFLEFYGESFGQGTVIRAISERSFALVHKDENVVELKIYLFGLARALELRISKFACVKDLDFFQKLWGKVSYVKEEEIKPEIKLKELGVELITEFTPWDAIGGCEDLKEEIKKTVILPFRNQEVYGKIVKETRKYPKDITPKAILLHGPPGTGKTTVGKAIAGEIKLPFVYVPIETIFTMWYGESAHRLAEIFNVAESYEKCILFIDEIDALAVKREEMHEESRRVLSVLLTRLDGIKTKPGILTIGATNRIEDLDPAVRRRFDDEIYFRLPNLKDRKEIFKLYAKHLSEEGLEELAKEAEGFSGSDIERIAKNVERTFGKKMIEEKISGLPSMEMYMQAIREEKAGKILKNSEKLESKRL